MGHGINCDFIMSLSRLKLLWQQTLGELVNEEKLNLLQFKIINYSNTYKETSFSPHC